MHRSLEGTDFMNEATKAADFNEDPELYPTIAGPDGRPPSAGGGLVEAITTTKPPA